MTQKRVHEVAKEFNVSSKEVMEILAKHNIQIKSHLGAIDNNANDILKKAFTKTTDVAGAMPINKQTTTPIKQNEVPKVVTPLTTKTDSQTSASTTPTTHEKTSPGVQRPPQKTDEVKPMQRPPQRPSDNQQRPPYNQSSNQQRPADQQQRPPYNNQQRPNTGYTNNNQQRPPYNQQPSNQQRPADQQQRPPYNNQQRPNTGYNNQQQRPPYNQSGNQQRPADQQQRPPYNNQQRPYSDQNRPVAPGGQPNTRPPYNNNRPAQGYNNQQNRPYNSQNNYQNRNTTGGNFNRPANTGNTPKPQTPSSILPTPGTDALPQKPTTFINKSKYNNKAKQDWNNKKNQSKEELNKHKQTKTNKPVANVLKDVKRPEKITVGDFITVKDLSSKMKCEPSEIIKKLFLLGLMVTINQDIDFETATLVAVDFGIEVLPLPPEQDPTEVPEVEDDVALRVLRPPVVTVMGHVDHGKTSLLDAIRKANVTAREAGGITQHIGAYQVTINNKKIVFLDTPGHEAFTSMRARGAHVTDIAILVVAADDGVMPQTIEAINHAKSAKVPIIVAINKIDKENSNLERIKQQLSEHELIPEDWGGDTVMVPVSAKQKIGLSDLLEMILLVAEMQELKANPNIPAFGTIIEAQLDKGRGPVATVLVQKGTLKIGDTIVAGTAYGKVRAMVNDRGEKVKKALPSTPVEVLGLSDVPQAGDVLQVTEERIARAVAEKRVAKKRLEDMQHNQKVSLDDLFKQIQDGKVKDLNILVKADVQGTIEALKQSLSKIKNEEVKVVIVHGGVGAITESDVMLASASNALIIGFNVRPDNNARKTAENEKVDIRLYRVIYDAINDVEAAIKGMLAPKFEEQIIGKVEIRKVMLINKVPISGCYVLEGKVTNNALIRIIRDGIVVHETKIDTLKRFKEDAKEVAAGYECGLTLENYRDIKENDILEIYKMQEVEVK